MKSCPAACTAAAVPFCVASYSADDPWMAGAFDYLDSELRCGPLMYGYRPGSDGMDGDVHPFGICSVSGWPSRLEMFG